MCNVFGKGFIILDSILTLIRKEKGTWKPHHYDLLDQNIEAIKNYWKQLQLPQTPKFHSLCHHIKDQIVMFDGTGSFSEDFVEKSHQDGFRDEKRSKGLLNKAQIAHLHCKWELGKTLPSVLRKQSYVEKRTKRNLSVDKKLLKSIECKKKRVNLYEEIVQEQLYNENSIIFTPKEKNIQELKESLEKNEL